MLVEQLSETGCGGFNVLLRGRSEFVVRLADNATLSLLGASISDGEQGIGDLRAIVQDQSPGFYILLCGFIGKHAHNIEKFIEQVVNSLSNESRFDAFDYRVGRLHCEAAKAGLVRDFLVQDPTRVIQDLMPFFTAAQAFSECTQVAPT